MRKEKISDTKEEITQNGKNRAEKYISTLSPYPKTEFSAPTKPDEEKIRKLFDKGLVPDEELAVYGKKKRIGKNRGSRNVMVMPHLEKRNAAARRIMYIILVFLMICFAAVSLKYVLLEFSDSKAGDFILGILDISSYITEDGHYVHGNFDGYVTIGDSIEDAVKILGHPVRISENRYYFGKSYLLIENETVVGFYIQNNEDFRVTVGAKKYYDDKPIYIGASARNVVNSLGTPIYYEKYSWIYEDVAVDFDETYHVSSFEKLY